jgi:hypothetical protein
MRKLEDGKKIYDNIKIPMEMKKNIDDLLKYQSEEELRAGEDSRTSDDSRTNKDSRGWVSSNEVSPGDRRRIPYIRYSAAAAAVVILCFTVVLNSSEVFAMSVAKLPIVGSIAKVLTVRSYESSENNKNITVKVPEVVVDETLDHAVESSVNSAINSIADRDAAANLTGSPSIVADVNAEIEKIVKDYLAEAKERMQGDKEAFLATGGTEEEWNKRDLTINVDYKIQYQKGNILSLMLTADESWYGAYDVAYFFNIDLNKNKKLTLEDVLGEDYVTIANSSIIKQMKERATDNPDFVYWGVTDGKDSSFDGFVTVDENTKFYLNKEGKPVVYFDKYEVAPGFMGAQEFVIQ